MNYKYEDVFQVVVKDKNNEEIVWTFQTNYYGYILFEKEQLVKIYLKNNPYNKPDVYIKNCVIIEKTFKKEKDLNV